jgi:hypothetical protein
VLAPPAILGAAILAPLTAARPAVFAPADTFGAPSLAAFVALDTAILLASTTSGFADDAVAATSLVTIRALLIAGAIFRGVEDAVETAFLVMAPKAPLLGNFTDTSALVG